jgi:hypothetical protein
MLLNRMKRRLILISMTLKLKKLLQKFKQGSEVTKLERKCNQERFVKK